MPVQQVTISKLGFSSKHSVIRCSVSYEELLYICVQTENNQLELHISSLTSPDVPIRQLRIALGAHVEVVSLIILTIPPKHSFQVAILTKDARVILLNASTFMVNDGERTVTNGSIAKIVSLDKMISSHDAATVLIDNEVETTTSSCLPVSMALALEQRNDVSFLLLVGCNDGSIIEIYGTHESLVTRRNFQVCSSAAVRNLHPLASFPSMTLLACWCVSEDTKSNARLILCCSPVAPVNIDVANKTAGRADQSEEEGDEAEAEHDSDSVWRETDPSLICARTADLERISSYYLHSDIKYLMNLIIPRSVQEARSWELALADTDAFPHTPSLFYDALINDQRLISLNILSDQSPMMRNLLRFGANNLRGVQLLQRAPTERDSSENSGYIATFSISLAAIYMFALPASKVFETNHSSALNDLIPVLQIDLLPLIYHHGLSHSGQQEAVEHALIGAHGLLLSTNCSRVLVCSPNLTVLKNLSLDGTVREISPWAVVSSSAVYVHTLGEMGSRDELTLLLSQNHGDSILGSHSIEQQPLSGNFAADLVALSGLLSDSSSTVFDITCCFEVSAQQNKCLACWRCLLWVAHSWSSRAGSDGEALLELTCKCLLHLLRHYHTSNSGGDGEASQDVWVEDFPCLSDIKEPGVLWDGDAPVWLTGLADLSNDCHDLQPTAHQASRARAILNLVIQFAFENYSAIAPRLLELCGDMSDLHSVALLLMLMDEIASAALCTFSLVERRKASQSTRHPIIVELNRCYTVLFSIADMYFGRLGVLQEQGQSSLSTISDAAVEILLGLFASCMRMGMPQHDLESFIKKHWLVFEGSLGPDHRDGAGKQAVSALYRVLSDATSWRNSVEVRSCREYCSQLSGPIVLELCERATCRR